jgi:UPF0271 protein
MAVIDLNADLGEGFGIWRLGDDDSLLDIVTSANVACGFHAGDPLTMQQVCARAADRAVAIGAQVGYRDLAGFGRRRMDVSAAELTADVIYQVGALDGFARAAGTRVGYVKPHGALYNTAMDDTVQAGAIVDAVAAYDASLPILGLPDSALAEAAARRGIAYVAEAFADRRYTPAGRLVDRGVADAVIVEEGAVIAQALSLVADHSVQTSEGSTLTVHAASLCLHGDTPGSVALARAVRAALARSGVDLRPFRPVIAP